MSMQFFPPDVLAKTTRIAKRNNLSLEVLIARNECLSLLIWNVIRIFEVNLRYFINQRVSAFTGDRNWWHNPKLIYGKHMFRAPYEPDLYEVMNLGFLLLLFSDRYHNKIWVPCLRNELVNWKQDRRALYKEFRNLVQIRNRIAHHEIVYNYPLVETVDFAKQLLVDINPVAYEELEGRNYAALIDKIRLGSGGGI
ncbi:MAG: hypothetical protein RLZZ12_430 [Actinomycetota bacterium]